MMKWLEAEEKATEKDRFEALFDFLKKERKRVEKIIQQSGENDKRFILKEKPRRTQMVNTDDDR